MAVKLDRAYSRAELLRLYAEIAYYGHGYYGLQAASCGYFGLRLTSSPSCRPPCWPAR